MCLALRATRMSLCLHVVMPVMPVPTHELSPAVLCSWRHSRGICFVCAFMCPPIAKPFGLEGGFSLDRTSSRCISVSLVWFLRLRTRMVARVSHMELQLFVAKLKQKKGQHVASEEQDTSQGLVSVFSSPTVQKVALCCFRCRLGQTQVVLTTWTCCIEMTAYGRGGYGLPVAKKTTMGSEGEGHSSTERKAGRTCGHWRLIVSEVTRSQVFMFAAAAVRVRRRSSGGAGEQMQTPLISAVSPGLQEALVCAERECAVLTRANWSWLFVRNKNRERGLARSRDALAETTARSRGVRLFVLNRSREQCSDCTREVLAEAATQAGDVVLLEWNWSREHRLWCTRSALVAVVSVNEPALPRATLTDSLSRIYRLSSVRWTRSALRAVVPTGGQRPYVGSQCSGCSAPSCDAGRATAPQNILGLGSSSSSSRSSSSK